MDVTPRRQVLALRAAGVLALALFAPVLVDRVFEVVGGLALISFQSNSTAWGVLDQYFHWFNARWVFDRVRWFVPWLILGSAGVLALRVSGHRLLAIIGRFAREAPHE